jgi:hypothetical protein
LPWLKFSSEVFPGEADTISFRFAPRSPFFLVRVDLNPDLFFEFGVILKFKDMSDCSR